MAKEKKKNLAEDSEELEKTTDNTEEAQETEETSETSDDNELEKAKAEAAAANDKYLRLFAEFDNYRKRTTKEKIESYNDATLKCIEQILPVLDSFELALKAPCQDEKFLKGMEMILNQFKTIFEKMNIKEIEALGEKFDPNIHNAIKQEDSDEYETDTICEVFQKGYMLGDRLIRPAMVAVVG